MASAGETSPALSHRSRSVAYVLLVGVLLVLAFRMTCGEAVRETLAQRAAAAANDGTDKAALVTTPFVGPAFVGAECGMMLLLAAGAAWMAALRGGIARGRVVEFLLIAGIVACGVGSVLHAANRFNAMAGLMDVGMALVAGWTVAVLCGMLGDGGRRVVVAGLAGILMLWVAKGYLQKFVEYPDLAAYVREHRDDVLRTQGIVNDEVQAKLFESRMNSGEVTGYLSFSNVLATGLIGLLTPLTAILVMWVRSPKVERKKKQQGEISIPALCAVLAGIAWLAGLALLPMTGSKGGTALGYLAVALTAVCGLGWQWVARRRKVLMVVGVVALGLGAAAVVGYGLKRDTLPSKSLMFRWHYWTASMPMVKNSPMWGVGLNNFGDYYTRFKRPASPEDVKDPHNFFVRLAAEMGLPAMALVAALAAWMLGRTMWMGMGSEGDERQKTRWGAVALAAGVASLAWGVLHVALTEGRADFNWYVGIISAVLATGMVVVAWEVMRSVSGGTSRPGVAYLMLAAGVGALGMLVYDQINMALVTGGVAMLFWVMLGTGNSRIQPQGMRGAAMAIAVCCAAVALAVGYVQARVMPEWDPAALEHQYLVESSQGHDVAARTALEAAMARSPNSMELRVQHVALLRDRLHEQVAEDIRQLLTWDHANARIRLTVALPNSDLPAAERAAILEEALRLDAQLPADELKRLSPEAVAQVRAAIAALRAPATQ